MPEAKCKSVMGDETTPRTTRGSKPNKNPSVLKCGRKQCGRSINVTKEQEFIQCERCKEHFHLECTGMNIVALKFIMDNDCADNFIKCCLPCQPQARKEIGCIKLLEMRINEVDKKIDEKIEELNKSVNSLRTEITEKLKSDIKVEMDSVEKTIASRIDELQLGLNKSNAEVKKTVDWNMDNVTKMCDESKNSVRSEVKKVENSLKKQFL